MPKAILLIADPNAQRRTSILRNCERNGGIVAVAAATLGETYMLIERHLPRRVAVAAELAELPEFEVLSDMLSMVDAEVIAFGHDKAAWEPATAGPAVDMLTAALLRGLEAVQPVLPQRATMPRAGASAPRAAVPAPPPASAVTSAIVIGASTGGITALETVLGTFPADCPPTLVVQHIRPGFAEGLVRRLDSLLSPKVVAAEDGMTLRRGTIYLATAPDQHLGLAYRAGLRTRLLPGPAVSGHRPSVDVLFSEAAAVAGRLELRAAILTGMGSDGAEGMCMLRRAGAITIAQDRETSVVWGMPRMAVEMGGAAEVLPLARIGQALVGREPARQRLAQ